MKMKVIVKLLEDVYYWIIGYKIIKFKAETQYLLPEYVAEVISEQGYGYYYIKPEDLFKNDV